MTNHTPTPAYIYCRVSSAKQVREGHGLQSQETRCRDFAKHNNYEIAGVYHDEGVSGGLIDRPGIQNMLLALSKHNDSEQPVVLIDDISRLARGLQAHFELRTAISTAGGRLESPSIEFGEDSDSILVENLLASVSQHQRQKNTEQVVNRMKARVKSGYWLFSPVVGYKYEDVKGHGKLLVRDEPVATAIQEAFEGYATGRFDSLIEVKRFWETYPDFPRQKSGEVHLTFVRRILSRNLYAGYFDVPKWNIKNQEGKHEALVSFETWRKVQERLEGKHIKAPARADTSLDFPLRGFVTCASCERPMTASWSKGIGGRYGYYFCQTKKCPNRRKNIPKLKIESAFEELLHALTPKPELLSTFRKMLEVHWQHRMDNAKQRSASLKQEIQQIDDKIESVIEKLVDCDNERVVAAYEKQIKTYDERKIELAEQARMRSKPVGTFEKNYRTACQFLENPWKLWVSEVLEHKRMVLKLAFAGRISYHHKQGYRTKNIALPFKVLGVKQNPRISPGVSMVEPKRIELSTS